MTLLDPQFPLVGTVHTGAVTRPLLDSVSWPRVGKAVAVESRSFCTFEPPYSKTHRVGLLQALVPPYSFWGFRRGLVCGYSYPTFIRANMEKGPCPRVLAPYSTPSRLVK